MQCRCNQQLYILQVVASSGYTISCRQSVYMCTVACMHVTGGGSVVKSTCMQWVNTYDYKHKT